jgi:hypothetical protein
MIFSLALGIGVSHEALANPMGFEFDSDFKTQTKTNYNHNDIVEEFEVKTKADVKWKDGLGELNYKKIQKVTNTFRDVEYDRVMDCHMVMDNLYFYRSTSTLNIYFVNANGQCVQTETDHVSGEVDVQTFEVVDTQFRINDYFGDSNRLDILQGPYTGWIQGTFTPIP